MGATKQPIDLITADVRRCCDDGLNAVEAICAKRATPVIFITRLLPDELTERAP